MNELNIRSFSSFMKDQVNQTQKYSSVLFNATFMRLYLVI